MSAPLIDSAPIFSSTDPATWPMALTVEHMAPIYHRAITGIKKACQRGRFVPAPFQVKPYLWRKVDVERHLFSARGGTLRRVG